MASEKTTNTVQPERKYRRVAKPINSFFKLLGSPMAGLLGLFFVAVAFVISLYR